MKLRSDARILVAALSTGPAALLAIDDPDIAGGEAVYGAEDWRDTCAPSFAFDSDGELRSHNGDRVYGPAIHYSSGTAEQLRAAWGGVADSGVFVDRYPPSPLPP